MLQLRRDGSCICKTLRRRGRSIQGSKWFQFREQEELQQEELAKQEAVQSKFNPKEKSNGAIDKPDEYGMMGNTDRPDPALKKKWFADSGTTTHICNDISLLHNQYDDVSSIDSVTGSAKISLRGEVFFKEDGETTSNSQKTCKSSQQLCSTLWLISNRALR